MNQVFFKSKLIFFLIVILLFSACSRVVFNTPQPEKGRPLASVPKFYIGQYENENLQIELKKEAIVVNGLSFTLTKSLPVDNQVQLRFYNNLYFINVGDSTGYSVFMAQFPEEDKLAIYMLNPDSRSLSRIRKYATVETLQSGSWEKHFIQLPKQGFPGLVDQELFDVVGVLTKQPAR